MSISQDYSHYSFQDLIEVYHEVNREKYPENFQALEQELSKRKQECGRLYTSAIRIAKEENNPARARTLFKEIIAEFPGSDEAQHAAAYLKNIANGSELQELKVTVIPDNMALEFKGTAQEYFRIWIVNLCLTLLTFGIFSAWAKVRKKRYFYSNMTLDSTPFQYLGMPIPILKGRIIAAILFVLYYSSTNFFTFLLPYVFAAGLIIAPWVLVQSAAFNARYTSFRNLTFRFDGSYKEGLKVLSAWGIIPALIIGTMFSWWGQVWIAAILIILLGILLPWWYRGIKNFIVTKTSFGGIPGQFSCTGGEFFKVYFMGGLIISGFGLLAAIVTGITTAVLSAVDFQNIVYLILIPIYIGYILSFAYIQANITNAVWNQITLGPIQFHCTLKGWDLAKLYITNIISIALSAGLLIPWATIRTLKYRVEQTQVFNAAELTAFKATPETEVQAVGSEITDFFDMDLTL